MKFSDSITDLAKALADTQAELKNPYNTADNPYFKSKYAPLPDILNAVRPVLAKNGVSIIQRPATDESGNTGVETMLLHKTGQYIIFEPYFLKPSKIDPQTAGGAITYARRYALNAALGISGEEDDDANGASAKGNGTPVCSFTLATQRNYAPSGQERQSDFIDIVAWQKTAEFVTRYFDKGQLVAVEGSIQTRSYTDREGNKRKAVEVLANSVHFAEKRNAEPSRQTAQNSGGYNSNADFEEISDDDLPF